MSQQQQQDVTVYRPPSSSAQPSTATMLTSTPVADDELKPTPDELKTAFRSTLAGRHGPDAPLLTRALREREEERLGLHANRNRVYDKVRIRIRFSDRTQIQAEFAESDTIDALYAFLHASVTPQAQSTDVILYTAPPKKEYRRNDPKVNKLTLRQLGLIPSAIVSLRWADPAMNSNTYPAPLLPHLQSQAQDLPQPQQQQQQQQVPASSASTAPASKPMPKWLKNIVSKSNCHAHSHLISSAHTRSSKTEK